MVIAIWERIVPSHVCFLRNLSIFSVLYHKASISLVRTCCVFRTTLAHYEIYVHRTLYTWIILQNKLVELKLLKCYTHVIIYVQPISSPSLSHFVFWKQSLILNVVQAVIKNIYQFFCPRLLSTTIIGMSEFGILWIS